MRFAPRNLVAQDSHDAKSRPRWRSRQAETRRRALHQARVAAILIVTATIATSLIVTVAPSWMLIQGGFLRGETVHRMTLATVPLLLDTSFHNEAHSQFALKNLYFTISKGDQRLFQDDQSRQDFINILDLLELPELNFRHCS